MSLFETNLAVLEARFPGIRDTLGEVPATRPNAWETCTAADGAPTARLGGMAVHSFRAPTREAVKIVRGAGIDSGMVCVFGFGLAYVAEAILDCTQGTVVVIEPDLERFKQALSERNLENLLGNERVSLVLDSDPRAFASLLSRQAPSKLYWLPLAAVRILDTELHDRFHEVFERRSGRQDINHNTLKRFGKSWVRNLAANLPVLAGAGGVADWEGVFEGFPVFLAAAGPSLEEVLPHLRDIATRMPVVAVDTAYRACLSAGIVPDILVVVDPQYWNSRHLDTCDTSSSILISESSTHPTVFRRDFRAVSFCSSIFPLGRYLEPFTRVAGHLGAGGSVATTAWDFARTTGASPVFVAGLDLGFPDLQTHFRGGYFEQRMLFRSNRYSPGESLAFHALRDGDPYFVPSNDGGRVLTDRRLAIYKWWFEDRLAERPECDTRNLSPRGVAIEGMHTAAVETLLGYPPRRPAVDEIIREVVDSQIQTDTTGDLVSGVRALLDELERLEDLCRSTLELVRRTRDRMERQQPITDEIAALEQSDTAIAEAQGKDVLGFLIRPALEALESNQSSLDSTEILYRELRESAAFHRRELEKHLPRLVRET